MEKNIKMNHLHASIYNQKEQDDVCPKCGSDNYVVKPAGDETYRECNDCKYYSGD